MPATQLSLAAKAKTTADLTAVWGALSPPTGPGWAAALALAVAVSAVVWAAVLWRRCRRLEASERRLQTLVANMPGGLILADGQARIQAFNPAAERIFGYAADEVMGAGLGRLLPGADGQALVDSVAADGDGGQLTFETSGIHKDGHTLPLGMSLAALELGGRRQYLAIVRDFSAQKALENDLARESRFANAVINSLPGVFYLLDQKGRCHRWNHNLERVTGYSGEEIAVMRPGHYFAEADHERIAAAVEQAFREGEVAIEADLVTKAGRAIPYLWTGFRVELDGTPYMAGVGMDISARKALENELTHRATTDPLTGIPNRLHFEQQLERELAKGGRYGRNLGLIMFDLDHFKSVNDSNGHEVGDSVLRQTVAVTKPLLRGGDLMARWGGEEFMVLAPETDGEGARELAERLRRALEGHDLGGHGEDLTASFGVSEAAGDDHPGSLVRRVDAALYRAKRQGRNRVELAPPGAGGADVSGGAG